MSDQSSSELEREAEAARERVAGTAASIREKLSAGQLIDEFAGMLTGGDLSGAANNLKAQVRDNPLPVVLIGAGIAWMAFGNNASQAVSARSRSFDEGLEAVRKAGGQTDASEGSSILGSVADGAKTAAASVGDTVSGMADSLTSTAESLGRSMLTGTRQGAGTLQHSVSGAAQEPLLVAALGLAIGAVVGAMLPASDLEKEQIGPHADRLRDDAKEMIDKGLDSAGRVASKAFDALKEEADKQGLVPGKGASVGERVGEVARKAAQTAEEAARQEMGGGSDKGQRKI